MSPDLEDALLCDFPVLYGRALLDGGFRCDDGWEPLIRDLSEKLERDCCVYDGEERPYVVQVKEKFGGLRVYVSHGTSKMYETIRRAEERSTSVCEVCGAEGRTRKHRSAYWVKTVCDSHAEEP
jgi:hypothetical protein